MSTIGASGVVVPDFHVVMLPEGDEVRRTHAAQLHSFKYVHACNNQYTLEITVILAQLQCKRHSFFI